ncbi:MAG: hypothetical protein AB7O96_14640 [Pseudobdellovibrionaceae bacterium]
MNRRSFLQNAGAFSSLALLGFKGEVALAETDRAGKLSILQGYTDATSTELSVVVLDKKLKYSLRDPVLNIKIAPTKKWNVTWPEVSEKSVDKMYFTNLDVSRTYIFEVRNAQGKLVDNRILKTLDVTRKDIHVAWMSCMHDRYESEQKRIWASAKAARPELLFFIGDSIYADSLVQMALKIGAKPPQIWKRFVETRETLDFYKFDQLIPVFSVWDDHDYGKNNADSTYPYKYDSLRIFETFFARTRQTEFYQKGPGCSMVYKAFGQKFLLIDNRTFQTAQCFWGNNLRDWIFNELETFDGPTWIMQGQQFFGGYCEKGSFERNYPVRFGKILKAIKDIGTPVFFASGDVHYSEVMKLERNLFGYDSFEMTSSSMHSYTKEPKPNNPRRLMATGQRNFIGSRMTLTDSGLDFSTYVRGENSVLWKKETSIELY